MPWIIERLAGAIDGNNRSFTLSQIPIEGTLTIFFTSLVLEPVSSQPDIMQVAYALNGVNVELGLAPQVGQDPPPWGRFFYEP